MSESSRVTAPFVVGSEAQRGALIDACEELAQMEAGGLDTEADCESDREQEARGERLSAALGLREQLEDCASVVALPLFIADRLGEGVALLVGHEMARVEKVAGTRAGASTSDSALS
jgi:hypothetical protein